MKGFKAFQPQKAKQTLQFIDSYKDKTIVLPKDWVYGSICPGNLLNSPLWVNSLFKQYAANQGITEEQVREKYINQVPMKRSCEYKDIEDVMVFLASDYSSYMTGQAINVTGGQQM